MKSIFDSLIKIPGIIKIYSILRCYLLEEKCIIFKSYSFLFSFLSNECLYYYFNCKIFIIIADIYFFIRKRIVFSYFDTYGIHELNHVISLFRNYSLCSKISQTLFKTSFTLKKEKKRNPER